MIEEQIQRKIKELINSINDCIPVEWSSLYIYTEMSEEGGTLYFFFNKNGEDRFFYSLLLDQDFDLSSNYVKEIYRMNYTIAREFWELFLKNGLPVWSNAVISITTSKLDIIFDYSPWLKSDFGPTDRLNYFRFKYLKQGPYNQGQKDLFNKMEDFQMRYNS